MIDDLQKSTTHDCRKRSRIGHSRFVQMTTESPCCAPKALDQSSSVLEELEVEGGRMLVVAERGFVTVSVGDGSGLGEAGPGSFVGRFGRRRG